MTTLLTPPVMDTESEPASACSPLDRLLMWRPQVGLDVIALALIVAVGAVVRLYDLGERAMHHDESLHATFAWYFYRGQGYVHDPLMHGPFLFHAMALVYLLLGVSDTTARIVPAVLGTAVIALPWLLRGVIGRSGALAAAGFLAVSPTMLYFSRFVGAGAQDIVLAVTTLLIVAAIWRYLDDGRSRWLYLIAGALSLSFATKEVTFMLALIFLLWLNGRFAADLAAGRCTSETCGGHDSHHAACGDRSAVSRTTRLVRFFPVAWLLAALWPATVRLRSRLGVTDTMPRSGDLLLLLGLFTAPQCAAAIQIPLKRFGYDFATAAPIAGVSAEGLIGGVAVGMLIAATTLAGLAWRRRDFLICAAIFWGVYVLLFTTFFTNLGGFATGIWGSLDYWIAQHGEERGKQPVFYYAMLTPLYEYLTLALAIAGVTLAAMRGRWLGRGCGAAWASRLAFVGAIALVALGVAYGEGSVRGVPFALGAIALLAVATRHDPLRSLLAFWAAAMFFGLSVAGEKMPWLEVHLALPLALLAALTVRDAVRGFDADQAMRRARRRVGLRVAGIGLVGVAAGVASASLLWPGDVTDRAALIVGSLAVAGALAVLVGVRSRASFGLALTVAALTLLGPLTIRDSVRASFSNGDTPNELLVYTQTSPQLKELAGRIDALARQSGEGTRLPITVDTSEAFTWPWAWYLRDYSDVQYVDLAKLLREPDRAAAIRPGTVLITMYLNENAVSLWPNVYGPAERLPHRWWFPEAYRGTTADSLLTDARDPDAWAWWRDFFLKRDVRQRIGAIDTVVYFARDGR